jgi:hypothetical protein
MVRLLLWSSAQGVGVATAASKMARRCAISDDTHIRKKINNH